MEYNKLTKQELIETLQDLEHLKSAIDFKDKEIYRLETQVGELKVKIENLTATSLEDKKSLKILDNVDNELQEYKALVEEQKEKIKILEKDNSVFETLKKDYNKLVEEFNVLVQFVETYLTTVSLYIQQSTSALQMFTQLDNSLRQVLKKEEV